MKQPQTNLQCLRGEKWQRVRSCHFFCQSLKITTDQESKTPRNQKNNKKKQDCTPEGEGVRCSLLGLFFCFLFFCFLFFFGLCKKKRNCKGEIAKSKLTHCRCIKHLKRRAPTVACSVEKPVAHSLSHGSGENRAFFKKNNFEAAQPL